MKFKIVLTRVIARQNKLRITGNKNIPAFFKLTFVSRAYIIYLTNKNNYKQNITTSIPYDI